MNLHVTVHAVERYIERVAPVTPEEARAALSSPAIHKAVEFGAIAVTLGTGQRVVIADGAIVTVLSKERRRIGMRRPRPSFNRSEGE